MMLRSRGERSGRFHRSPSRRPWVYLSSAGATRRTSSSVGRGGRTLGVGAREALLSSSLTRSIHSTLLHPLLEACDPPRVMVIVCDVWFDADRGLLAPEAGSRAAPSGAH